MSIVADALTAHLPPRAHRKSSPTGTRYEFDCPLCAANGHTRDTLKRGRIYINGDGSCGYSCHQCHHNTRTQADMGLTQKMEAVLIALGMDSLELKRLKFDLWAKRKAAQYGPSPTLPVPKQPLPTGAKPIGDWIAENIADPNFNDLLEDLADMNPSRRDGYYWTPEPGDTGDMNRRYIWVIGDPTAPDAWAGQTIDGANPEPVVGDADAWIAATSEDDELEEEEK